MMDHVVQFLQNQDILLKGELLLRILIAVLCGAVIGYERTNRGKGAGIRTHTIVAIASCLMMIISQYGFGDFFENFNHTNVEMRLDPSRIAAQIVSGIGFLGAGMIFIQKNVVTGLTTAAGIWAVAGIGMAVGCGMYFISIVCTLIIVFVQFVMHKSAKFFHTHTEESITFILEKDEENIDFLIQQLKSFDLNVLEIECTNKDDVLELNVIYQSNNDINKAELLGEIYSQNNVKQIKM